MSKPFNPQSTVFSNLMLDEIMPKVSPNAWKILCLAMRKTAGWADYSTESGRKEADIISLSQFESGCGISRHTVIDAINECLDKGYLLRAGVGQAFQYRLNVNYDTSADSALVNTQTSAEIAPVTSAESAQTNSNINSKLNTKGDSDIKRTEYLANIEEHKRKTSQAIDNFNNKNHRHSEDIIHQYPPDVQDVLGVVCELWQIDCPPIKSSNANYWVSGARELIQACAEYKGDALRAVRKDLDQRRGRTPISIASPRSLINMVRAKVGELRTKEQQEADRYVFVDGYRVPQNSPEIAIGGKVYNNYAD